MTIREAELSDEDRRGFGRRLSSLENKYELIFTRLDGLDALKNQIAGMVALVKFIGWGGIIAGVLVFLRYMTTGLR